jgi:ABC-2 type transport system ATP-binding protein
MLKTILLTENLTKLYGDLTAVDDLSLEIREGEVFGLLGPNGAGKTTSINMMCGLLKPDAGRVFIHGKPINGGDPKLRARVGVCPQQAILWEKLTCLEQLQFVGEMYGLSRRAARKSGEDLLAELDLSEKRDKLGSTLSGGMKRRLNLALALVHDPEIVVLDEPEAGLDPQSRVRVRDYIQSLARRKTVILTTHNMDEAERLADRVAIIDRGRLLVLDTPDALKQSLGQGDVIEIGIQPPVPEDAARICQQTLASLGAKINFDTPTLTLHLRIHNAVRNLPSILSTLQQAGLEGQEVNLRANTLEDVFIQLTGRRLRE